MDVAVNVVLVEQAQSGQPYHVCWNAVAPNMHATGLSYPMQDMQWIWKSRESAHVGLC